MYEFKKINPDPKLLELGIHSKTYNADYEKITRHLNLLIQGDNDEEFYKICNAMGSVDFFFFCYFILKLPVNNPFLLARINEIEDKSSMCLDLWAREHWKSTLLTFALPLWELVKNREERIVIFSHTRTLAKSHLRRLKIFLEGDSMLCNIFPDVFYRYPKSEAPKWSEDDGLYLRRLKTYNEASIEAWGLVDGMPTGKHYSIRIYDDIITERSVATSAQVEKANKAFQLSENLGTRGGKKRIIGTRYHKNDVYGKIIKKLNKYWTVRKYPAEVDEKGEFKMGGIPVYLTKEELIEKYDSMGEYIYSSQMGQTPTAQKDQKFHEHFLRYYKSHDVIPEDMNYYLFVDPAGGENEGGDYTAMIVIGADSLRNYWIIDMVRDRIELGDKWENLRKLVQQYDISQVYYERYSMQSDIQHYKERMEAEGVFFDIKEVGGGTSKIKRIQSLLTLFMKGRIILPRSLPFEDKNGNLRDLTYEFVYDEYLNYPYSSHDDMMDCLARILDSKVEIVFPTTSKIQKVEIVNPFQSDEEAVSWMGL